jgi:transposase-like protein
MTAEAVEAATHKFKKAIIERALGAEMSHHLGYAPGEAKPGDVTNHRNGKSAKTVLTDGGPLTLDIPRDRHGNFAPLLIPKHERRFTGFDEKIIAMYARCQAQLNSEPLRAFLRKVKVSHMVTS